MVVFMKKTKFVQFTKDLFQANDSLKWTVGLGSLRSLKSDYIINWQIPTELCRNIDIKLISNHQSYVFFTRLSPI